MTKHGLKWLTLGSWIVSWGVIFWINFSAELSLMMHFFAIPLLLLSTAVGAAHLFEHKQRDESSQQ